MNYKVFVDVNAHEIYAILNDKGECFIEIKIPDSEMYSYSVLNKSDLEEFIKELQLIKSSM